MSFIGMRSSLLPAVLALATVIVLVAYSGSAEATENLPAETGGNAALPPPQVDGDLEGESDLPWLFAVFFITWAAFFGYVFVMSRRQREMRREIDALRRVLAQRETEKDNPAKEGSG